VGEGVEKKPKGDRDAVPQIVNGRTGVPWPSKAEMSRTGYDGGLKKNEGGKKFRPGG